MRSDFSLDKVQYRPRSLQDPPCMVVLKKSAVVATLALELHVSLSL